MVRCGMTMWACEAGDHFGMPSRRRGERAPLGGQALAAARPLEAMGHLEREHAWAWLHRVQPDPSRRKDTWTTGRAAGREARWLPRAAPPSTPRGRCRLVNRRWQRRLCGLEVGHGRRRWHRRWHRFRERRGRGGRGGWGARRREDGRQNGVRTRCRRARRMGDLGQEQAQAAAPSRPRGRGWSVAVAQVSRAFGRMWSARHVRRGLHSARKFFAERAEASSGRAWCWFGREGPRPECGMRAQGGL